MWMQCLPIAKNLVFSLLLGMGLALAPLSGIAAPKTPSKNAAKNQMFRYTDSAGNVILDDAITPEAITQGYEILNSQGIVIQTVPPAKTKEQLEQERAQALEDAQRKKEAALQQQSDTVLLQTFLTPEDLLRSRNSKIDAILVSINITQDEINRLTAQLAKQHQSAANAERTGRAVSPDLLASIKASENQIISNQKSLIERQEEMVQIITRGEAEYTRLIELLNQRTPNVQYFPGIEAVVSCPATGCDSMWKNLKDQMEKKSKQPLYVSLSHVLLSAAPKDKNSLLWAGILSDKGTLTITLRCTAAAVDSCPKEMLETEIAAMQGAL